MSDRSKDECTADATPRVLMRCSRCHSPNVMRDAWAVWNAATQEWELGPIYDHSACDDCGAEGCIEEITPDGTPVPPDASLQRFVESIERGHALQAADAAKESPRAVEVARQLAEAQRRAELEAAREALAEVAQTRTVVRCPTGSAFDGKGCKIGYRGAAVATVSTAAPAPAANIPTCPTGSRWDGKGCWMARK